MWQRLCVFVLSIVLLCAAGCSGCKKKKAEVSEGSSPKTFEVTEQMLQFGLDAFVGERAVLLDGAITVSHSELKVREGRVEVVLDIAAIISGKSVQGAALIAFAPELDDTGTVYLNNPDIVEVRVKGVPDALIEFVRKPLVDTIKVHVIGRFFDGRVKVFTLDDHGLQGMVKGMAKDGLREIQVREGAVVLVLKDAPANN